MGAIVSSNITEVSGGADELTHPSAVTAAQARIRYGVWGVWCVVWGDMVISIALDLLNSVSVYWTSWCDQLAIHFGSKNS